MIDSIVSLFDNPIFMVLGGIFSLLTVVTFLYTFWIVVKGVMPVWYRLGLALTKRKIVIFAKDDNYENLKNVLVESDLFKEKNIKMIDEKSIQKAENDSILLVHWNSYKDNLEKILSIKKDTSALIVYAPTEEGRIDENSMAEMSKHRNVIIVNFRGRLLNDVLVSMMTSRR